MNAIRVVFPRLLFRILALVRSIFVAVCIVVVLSKSAITAQNSFLDVESWGYQLTGYDKQSFDQLVRAPLDLLVIDLARDGNEDFFSAADIRSLKSQGKFVLAYFEIGAIEQYRPEWPAVPAELKAGPVDGWPKEQYVKYWDPRWWPIVRGRIDRSLEAKFDGVFLDLITAYDEIPLSVPPKEERATRMVDLLVRISRYARQKNSGFKIVAQNCPELATWSFWTPRTNHDYLNAIDGIALESPFYLAHDKPCDASWCEENRRNAKTIKEHGKLLLGVDYAKKQSAIENSYSIQIQEGFVPFIGERNLDGFSNGFLDIAQSRSVTTRAVGGKSSSSSLETAK